MKRLYLIQGKVHQKQFWQEIKKFFFILHGPLVTVCFLGGIFLVIFIELIGRVCCSCSPSLDNSSRRGVSQPIIELFQLQYWQVQNALCQVKEPLQIFSITKYAETLSERIQWHVLECQQKLVVSALPLRKRVNKLKHNIQMTFGQAWPLRQFNCQLIVNWNVRPMSFEGELLFIHKNVNFT